MAFNGSGVFYRVRNWVADATAGIKIRSDYHDAEDDGFAAGLTNCITKDGQTVITQNIPFNSKRITGLADPINPQDAATKASIATEIAGTALPLTGGTITGDLTVTGDLTAGDTTVTSLTSTGKVSAVSNTYVPTTAVDAAAFIASGSYGGGLTFIDGEWRGSIYAQSGNLSFATSNDTTPDTKLTLNNDNNHSLTGNLTISGTLNSNGVAVFGNIPINPQNNYTTVATDAQKCIPGTGTNTINGALYPDGTCITFYANGATLNVNNTESMFWRSPGGDVAGNRVLANRGICTVLKITGGHWVISGSGLT